MQLGYLCILVYISSHLAYGFILGASNYRKVALKASINGVETGKAKESILVYDDADENSKQFLTYINEQNEYNLQRYCGCGQLPCTTYKSNDSKNGNILLVMTIHDMKKQEKLNIDAHNSIYLLSESNTNPESVYREACKYDIYVNENYSQAYVRLNNLLNKVRSKPPTLDDTKVDAGQWSHFLSLTYPSIDEALPYLPELRVGIDAFELRVDLLKDISTKSIHRQIALLRDNIPLPIVFTVRSVGQIGKFPPDPDKIFQLLQEGVRAGCEWIDVEACWPDAITQSLVTNIKANYVATSRILGSLHVTTPQSKDEIVQLFRQSSLGGNANVLKVVTGASDKNDCELIHRVGADASKEYGDIPYIGVCLGDKGARSRVLNQFFTPVTHPLMATAAPGQLNVEQLMSNRLQEKLLQPKMFYLFGTPIKQSMSPAMHNGAYKALRLPHVYNLNEQTDVTTYQEVINDPNFGGASVTIPHKETIIPLLDEVKGAAKVIGAVNTIVLENNKKVGYNTDWIGMKRPILSKLQARGVDWKDKIGIVIGAGGTAKAACYAVKDLGLKIILCNRTPDKGQDVADAFGCSFMTLDELKSNSNGIIQPENIAVVISTLPAAANFTLPDHILPHQPVILDVVYKPVRTSLMEQAIANNCPRVQGATMLLEQGIEQFQLWNRRRAPRTEMENAVFYGLEKL